MTLAAHLIHTCDTERATTATDAYGNPKRTYAAHLTGEPCRLVEKRERIVRGDLTAGAIVTTYLLLVGADADIRESDRIAKVTLEDGTEDVRRFVVESLLSRRNARGIHHKTAVLQAIGEHANGEA